MLEHWKVCPASMPAACEPRCCSSAISHLVLLFCHPIHHPPSSTLQGTFQRYDRDRSGSIEAGELHGAIRDFGVSAAWGKRVSGGGECPCRNSTLSSTSTSTMPPGYNLSPQAIHVITKRYSKRSDGQIHFDDFVACSIRLRSMSGLLVVVLLLCSDRVSSKPPSLATNRGLPPPRRVGPGHGHAGVRRLYPDDHGCLGTRLGTRRARAVVTLPPPPHRP